jgi:protoporphyrinogen oxidase
MKKKAIIIGGGPAGLTAAYELLTRSEIIPIIVEQEDGVGGLSKTVQYHGNRLDIGGHRFFSKSERITEWWFKFLPLDQSAANPHIHLTYQQKEMDLQLKSGQTGRGDQVMLLRPRKSRIFYRDRFFDYPLRLDLSTLRKLGGWTSLQILISYIYSRILPIHPEKNLEDFFCNRFGRKLYETFFRDYTEKVWGLPCSQIPRKWGAQRVKDLSISRLAKHALRSMFQSDRSLSQLNTSTSLIEQFLYPKFGPGQIWDAVADEIRLMGGKFLMNSKLKSLSGNGSNRIVSAFVVNLKDGTETILEGDYFISSMPVRELVASIDKIEIDEKVRQIAGGLQYRDFIIVGLLVKKMSIQPEKGKDRVEDNWIYLQDNSVRAGRIQLFHNWSHWMVSNPEYNWLGVEYFVNEEDEFWKLPDERIIRIAVEEMEKIGMINSADLLDSTVVRALKAYPSYTGSYESFGIVQDFLDSVENCFPVGRNGMHRYNNTDHSMLTAMTTVDHIVSGSPDKSEIWKINSEESYHEEKK